MKDKLLKHEDFNVIIVDWSNGAKSPYEQAAGNTRMLGVQTATLIRFLMNDTNTKADAIYILESDLGAHVAGYAGKGLKQAGTPPGRITGMQINK